MVIFAIVSTNGGGAKLCHFLLTLANLTTIRCFYSRVRESANTIHHT